MRLSEGRKRRTIDCLPAFHSSMNVISDAQQRCFARPSPDPSEARNGLGLSPSLLTKRKSCPPSELGGRDQCSSGIMTVVTALPHSVTTRNDVPSDEQ